jgi:hypothetical protein
MARGLRQGDGSAHLLTFHPRGGQGSAQDFHNDDWLDFNMRQNGLHVKCTEAYQNTQADYSRTPVKPVLDGEPISEDHPVSFRASDLGHSIASDVRRPLYWNLFTGAFGHTYGHHSVWQMWEPGRDPFNNPLLPWHAAIDQPGAGQMQYGRWLMESRPFLLRVPDDSILVPHRSAWIQSENVTQSEPARIVTLGQKATTDLTVPTSVPGAGRYRFVATRDLEGTYAMVYAPVGRSFWVRMEAIGGAKVTAWWYNPRDGQATLIGIFDNRGEREFTPPNHGEMLDWILVLDDAAKQYPAPGTRE